MKNGWKGYYLTAYGIAVKHGFKGSEEEWLESLEGKDAYETAKKHGFDGTYDEWVESLRGAALKFEDLTPKQKAEITPTVNIEKLDNGYRIKLGEEEFFITNGADGFSPTVTVSDEADGVEIVVIGSDGIPAMFKIYDRILTETEIQKVIAALPDADEVKY